MEILIAATAVFGVLTVFFFGRMVRCTRHGRVLRAGGSGVSCVASLAVATSAALMLFTYFTYTRLTDEQVVSKIEFRRTGTDEYQARLMVDGEIDQLFVLRGDEWQMDARIVSWKPPMTIAGLDPVYRLERLSGRYSDISREKTQDRTVHALFEERPVDIWEITRSMPFAMPGVDAYYGSATYLPMADGARFSVSLTRDALVARPANDAARAAIGDWGIGDQDSGDTAQ
jgi:hypothetical protein